MAAMFSPSTSLAPPVEHPEPEDQPVTDELLNEMGKALAKRLNALVDALDE